MSRTRDWSFRLRHILEAIEKIQRYTRGLSEAQLAAPRFGCLPEGPPGCPGPRATLMPSPANAGIQRP